MAEAGRAAPACQREKGLWLPATRCEAHGGSDRRGAGPGPAGCQTWTNTIGQWTTSSLTVPQLISP